MNREKLLQNPLPVDRVAARVVRAKGEHWSPKIKAIPIDQDVMGAPPEFSAERPCNSPDYTGLRRGQITLLR
jgi:hypothetical protein